MINYVQRLAMALAAMNLSEKEIEHLLVQVRLTSPREFINLVTAFRSLVGSDLQVRRSSNTKHGAIKRRDSAAAVGIRVERLLKDEAGLSTRKAVELLSRILVESQVIDRKQIPSLSRKALSIWVERLARKIPGKDLLRFATLLRNQYVHRPVTDWNLRDGSK